MMQHGPGLAASAPVRNNLEVGRRGILFLRFSAVRAQSLYEAAVRVLFFEQRRSAGSHPLVEQQTLPQTTAPNHCYGYRCTIPRRSVPISRLLASNRLMATSAFVGTDPGKLPTSTYIQTNQELVYRLGGDTSESMLIVCLGGSRY